jgi:acylphosphatase
MPRLRSSLEDRRQAGNLSVENASVAFRATEGEGVRSLYRFPTEAVVAESQRVQREVFYSGQVQGIGFRYTARQFAAEMGMNGFVRNLPDGRVQLVVEGSAAQIGKFLEAIEAEIGYHIHNVQATERPATGRYATFEIRH